MLLGAFICGIIGLVYLLIVGNQADHSEEQSPTQTEEIIRKNSLMILMGQVLDRVDTEIQHHPTRSLSVGTIARIAAVNQPFQTYSYLEESNDSTDKLSIERGQLLQALSYMNMDSSSFDEIKEQTSFSGADLRNTRLQGKNLKQIDLRGANLKHAELQQANLTQADLRDAYLWAANLQQTQLEGANLNRSNLSWADLTEANLSGAALDGAILTDAKLRKANLIGASVQWSDGRGAWLLEANLAGVDLLATDLRRANLSKANLCETNLTRTNVREANLMDAELEHAAVQEDNWLDLLEKWQVLGAAEIRASYKMVPDTTGLSKYRLEKINDWN